MKRKIIVKIICLIVITICCVSCSGTGNNGNYPYEPATPSPDPHEGVFVSEYGEMIFNGDGKSITVKIHGELCDLMELEEGEYSGTYVFLSGNLPPNGSVEVRYDVAHELKLELNVNDTSYVKVFDVGLAADDGSTGTVGVDIVTAKRIPLLFSDDSHFFDVIFTKND